MFQALRALFVATPNLQAQWNVHYGAHQFWKQVVYDSFKVADIHQVLNVEPPIDHGEHYNATIPEYFYEYETLGWVNQHINSMSPTMRAEAIQIVEEAASIEAAHAMCHPYDRVGKFDWSDVVALHESLRTPYDKFFEQQGMKNVTFLHNGRNHYCGR
jgi:hypothetical protein